MSERFEPKSGGSLASNPVRRVFAMISNCCADYPLRAKCLLGKPLQPEGERDPYAWLTAESSLKTLVRSSADTADSKASIRLCSRCISARN
jgi:hypothetical protein